MTTPAQSRGLRKGIRDLFQAALAVVAAGGTTALIDLILGYVNPIIAVPIGVAYKILVTYAMNYLETAGRIPVMLPTPGIIPTAEAAGSALAPVVGAVEAVSDEAGEVTGTVTDTAGEVVGRVTGLLGRRGAGLLGRRSKTDGGIPLALVILIALVLVVLAGFGLCGDALFEDEDERNDIGLVRVELVSHDYDEGGCEYGNCGEREEDYGDGSCKYFCPAFDDSPVQDSFNVCLPGSQCHFDGDRRRDEPPPNEGEPQ